MPLFRVPGIGLPRSLKAWQWGWSASVALLVASACGSRSGLDTPVEGLDDRVSAPGTGARATGSGGGSSEVIESGGSVGAFSGGADGGVGTSEGTGSGGSGGGGVAVSGGGGVAVSGGAGNGGRGSGPGAGGSCDPSGDAGCATEDPPRCGDGELDSDEECDAGDENGLGECSSSCEYFILKVAAQGWSTCALRADGRLKCWGDNPYGGLGVGDVADRGGGPSEMGSALPEVDLGTADRAAGLAGGYQHACVLLGDASVKCWGLNGAGELGLGDTEDRGDEPGEMGDALPQIDLGTGRTAHAIAADKQSCALLDDGTVKCWGYNGTGQLGLGDTSSRGDEPGEMGDALPRVDLGSGVVAQAIAAGGHHTCALLDDGTVKCWGFNGLGQLGLGDTSSRGDEPGEMGDALPRVDLGSGVVAQAVAAGGHNTCVLLTDGAVKCWGSNFDGSLGYGHLEPLGDEPGEMGDALPTIDLGAGRYARVLDLGFFHTCAVLDDDSLKCWGDSFWGKLGLGDTNSRGNEPNEMGSALPAVNLGFERLVGTVATGADHSCAVIDRVAVKCWGRNVRGQLGLGDKEERGYEAGDMGDNLPAVDLW